MRLTQWQINRLTWEISQHITDNFDSFKFDVRDHVHNVYHGDLHSPDGATWHITFEDPKYETLFTLKHPPMPSFQQDL